MIDQLKPLLGKLALFSQERLGFKHPPRLFLRNDSQNSQQALGKTAFYNPQEQSVTLFIHGRHPKDILRSFTHELVHHCQNERGDLAPEKMTASGDNYAQECPHMRKMEQEAYLEGSMCFRDWEDTIEDKDLILIKLAESKFLKENKTMTTKITKEFLKETIRKVLKEQELAMSLDFPQSIEAEPDYSQDMSIEDPEKSGSKNDDIKMKAAQQKRIAQKFGFSIDDIQLSLLKMGYFDNTPQGAKVKQQYGGLDAPEALVVIVDGKYGESTKQAIISMQEDLNLLPRIGGSADGVIGARTLQAFKAAIVKPEKYSKNPRVFQQFSEKELLNPDNNFAQSLDKVPESGLPADIRDQSKTQRSMGGEVELKPVTNLEEGGCGSAPGKRCDDKSCSSCYPMEEAKSEKKCSTCGGKKPDGKCPHCDDKKKDAKCICGKITENEELEEASDKDGDGHVVPDWADQNDNDPKVGPKSPKSESKIQTPEQENTLYEQRFAAKNNRLFEKLVKEWTK